MHATDRELSQPSQHTLTRFAFSYNAFSRWDESGLDRDCTAMMEWASMKQKKGLPAVAIQLIQLQNPDVVLYSATQTQNYSG